MNIVSKKLSLGALTWLVAGVQIFAMNLAGALTCEDVFNSRTTEQELEGFYSEFRRHVSPLESEAENGAYIQHLLTRPGFDLSHRYSDGRSLFVDTSLSQYVPFAVARLLRRGFDIYERGPDGRNALIELIESIDAKTQGHAVLLAIMSEGQSFPDGYKVRVRSPRPEDFMVFDQNGRVVRNALANANSLAVDHILMGALERQNFAVLDLLIGDMGARHFSSRFYDMYRQPGQTFKPGVEFMFEALSKNAYSVVAYLLVNQAFRVPSLIRDARTGATYFSLQYAIGQRLDPRIVRLMLERGADTEAEDARGIRAMDVALAVRRRHKDSRYVDLLKERGVHMPSILRQVFPPDVEI